uniref:Uncharacterized protein n=1 Tax=Globodera rostochiensis TaxID=31243 RepID=A0A914HNR2_GLORO
MGEMEFAAKRKQEQQQQSIWQSHQNREPYGGDGGAQLQFEQETAAVKAEGMEASTVQQNNDSTPGYEGPDPNQTDGGCATSLPQTRTRGLRGGRQFRERMERRLGSDWKKALKEQRQAQRQLANASIASGADEALRRSAQPPAAGPSAEMDPAAVEVAKVEMPPLVVAKDEC